MIQQTNKSIIILSIGQVQALETWPKFMNLTAQGGIFRRYS